MVESFRKNEKNKEKERWRRIRWLAAHIINISMKSVKHPVRADHLITFIDEIEVISPEEQKKRAEKTLQFHKKKFWSLLKTDKDGKVKIFDEEDYKALQEKRKKHLNN